MESASADESQSTMVDGSQSTMADGSQPIALEDCFEESQASTASMPTIMGDASNEIIEDQEIPGLCIRLVPREGNLGEYEAQFVN